MSWEGLHDFFDFIFWSLSKDLVKPGIYFWASNKLKRTMSGRWQKKVERQMVMDGDQVDFFFFFATARGEHMLYCQATQQHSLQALGKRAKWREGEVRSALSAPRTPMFTTAGPKQCLQSHLHKCLEVIASLPSAVLRGDKTQTDTFTGDTALHFTPMCHM